MSDDDDLCVHGNPLGNKCEGLCKHDVRCGEQCDACDKDYMGMLHWLCNTVGQGDPELGRQAIIETLLLQNMRARMAYAIKNKPLGAGVLAVLQPPQPTLKAHEQSTKSPESHPQEG